MMAKKLIIIYKNKTMNESWMKSMKSAWDIIISSCYVYWTCIFIIYFIIFFATKQEYPYVDYYIKECNCECIKRHHVMNDNATCYHPFNEEGIEIPTICEIKINETEVIRYDDVDDICLIWGKSSTPKPGIIIISIISGITGLICILGCITICVEIESQEESPEESQEKKIEKKYREPDIYLSNIV